MMESYIFSFYISLHFHINLNIINTSSAKHNF